MATNEDLINDIETNATSPKKAMIDGNSAEQHSLKEQIEFDRYQRSLGATQSTRGLGIRLRRLKPPGTV